MSPGCSRHGYVATGPMGISHSDSNVTFVVCNMLGVLTPRSLCPIVFGHSPCHSHHMVPQADPKVAVTAQPSHLGKRECLRAPPTPFQGTLRCALPIKLTRPQAYVPDASPCASAL